jgi:hypothetical protein
MLHLTYRVPLSEAISKASWKLHIDCTLSFMRRSTHEPHELLAPKKLLAAVLRINVGLPAAKNHSFKIGCTTTKKANFADCVLLLCQIIVYM